MLVWYTNCVSLVDGVKCNKKSSILESRRGKFIISDQFWLGFMVALVLASASVMAKLPLHGAEFGIVGVVFVLFSIWFMARKIVRPTVCPI